MILTSAVLLMLAWPAAAGEDARALAVLRAQTEVGQSIQRQLADPLLGPGQSSVMVSLDLETKLTQESSERSGVGKVNKTLGKGRSQQEARQLKGIKEEKEVVSVRFPNLRILVLHEASVPLERLDKLREAIVEAYRFEADLKAEDVRFLALAPKASPR